MNAVGIAVSAGITTHAIQSLLQGTVTPGIAARLNTPSTSLQAFLNGGTSVGLAVFIGCTSANLQDLRNAIGEQGAIGFLLGLCVQKAASVQT